MTNHLFIYTLKVISLALAYFIAGKLSLLLAIPPGFASPVWPAAGIALSFILLGGYRYLPGVFVGFFAANLQISVNAGGGITDTSTLLIAFCIALGATLQATTGYYLIRRVVSLPTPMEQEQDLALIILLGGPLACVVNAIIGPVTLMLAGFIPSQEAFLLNAFVWWAGDTIGVISITPLLLFMAVSKQRADKSRKLVVAIPSVVILTVVIILFIFARNDGQNATQDEFSKRVLVEANLVDSYLQSVQNNLTAIARLFASQEHVTREQFNRFSKNYAAKRGLQALEWAPRVFDQNKAGFEERVQKQGFVDFRITEMVNSNMVFVSKRKQYFPVLYLAPKQTNRNAFGFDLGSNPVRLAALFEARDSGKQIASASISLVQESGEQLGLILFNPVYQTSAVVDTLDERRKHLSGFIVGVIRVEDLIEAALTNLTQNRQKLHIIDNYIRGDAATLYGTVDENAVFLHQQVLEFAGRQWSLNFTPTDTFLFQQSGWQAWSVLIAGLFFATLIQAMLLIVTARTAVVDRLVKQKTKALLKSEKKMSAVVDNTVDGIFTIDERGIIESVNKAGEQIFGYQKEELLARNIKILMPSPYQEAHDGYLQRYQDTGLKKIIGVRRELTGKRKDGTIFPIELAVGEIKLGPIKLFSGIVRDITERKKTALDQQKLIERLSQSNKQLERFAFVCSHDLQEPVRMVMSFGQLLEKGIADQLDEKNKRYLKHMIDGSTRAREMISDILIFCQLDQVTEARSEVSISDVCRQIKNTLKLTLEEKNAEFKWTEPMPSVNAIRSQMFQIFINLVSNGIKFNTSDNPQVIVSVKEDEQKFHFKIKDNGIGIDKKYQHKLFQLFQRLVNKSDYPGTGLGLAICKKIADENNAEFSIESEVGVGSQFILSWPKKID